MYWFQQGISVRSQNLNGIEYAFFEIKEVLSYAEVLLTNKWGFKITRSPPLDIDPFCFCMIFNFDFILRVCLLGVLPEIFVYIKNYLINVWMSRFCSIYRRYKIIFVS